MPTHFPVLLKEAVNGLNIQADGCYIDATFGRGGHSALILTHLSAQGRLLAIDKDLQAIEVGRQKFANDARFEIVQGSFSELAAICQSRQLVGKVNGILLDLGLSSPQIDTPERGFSFQTNGPLDMRMNQTQGQSAADWVQYSDAREMAQVFKNYGEERFAKRIANAIVEARQLQVISTTAQLAKIVSAANPAWEKHKHPATRVFQAIRIAINNELDDLKVILDSSTELLADKGRLVVISFHSLEDRLAKRFMRDAAQGQNYPKGVPVLATEIQADFKKPLKAVKPSSQEVAFNNRSRSAVLRVAERQRHEEK